MNCALEGRRFKQRGPARILLGGSCRRVPSYLPGAAPGEMHASCLCAPCPPTACTLPIDPSRALTGCTSTSSAQLCLLIAVPSLLLAAARRPPAPLQLTAPRLACPQARADGAQPANAAAIETVCTAQSVWGMTQGRPACPERGKGNVWQGQRGQVGRPPPAPPRRPAAVPHKALQRSTRLQSAHNTCLS